MFEKICQAIRAYSGLTDAEITELSDWFRAHTLEELTHGKVCLVEPRVVLEVTFDRVQASQRHKSGYALRFPRILRVRGDKPPEEIDTLETVRRLAEKASSDPTWQEPESFVDAAATTLDVPPTELKKEGGESVVFQSENNINSTPTLEAARDAFKTFLDRVDRHQRVVVLHDSDADGVTAGIVLQLALSRAGFEKVTLVVPDRDRNAWTPANRSRVQAASPAHLFYSISAASQNPSLPV